MKDDENTPEPEIPTEDIGEKLPEPAATENPDQTGLPLPDEAVNLVPALLTRALTDKDVEKFVKEKVPEMVNRHLDEGEKQRSAWMQKRKERVDLWLGNLKPKTEPWKNCANMHDPILLSRTLRLSSRVFAEIFKQGQPVFAAQAGSKMTEERAMLATQHQNYQFRKEIPDFPTHVHRSLHEFFRDGECVFKSYRDIRRGVNCHEYRCPEDFVYPYTCKTTAVDMSDVPWKIDILRYYKRDLREMGRMGFYCQVEEVLKEKGSQEDDIERPVRDSMDKYEGIDRTESEYDSPYTVLEWHGWLTLPGETSEIPVRAVVDKKTKTLMGLYSRYYDDPVDRARFDRESAEHQQYMQETEQFTRAMALEQQLLTRIQQPDVPPEESQQISQQVQAQRPQPPMKPRWMDEQGSPPKPVKQKVIEQFSHGRCIENPDGSMGLGVGLLIEPHQRAANIMLNQFIDQGTLANGKMIFLHEFLKLPTGMTSMEPNTLVRVGGIAPDQVEKAIHDLSAPPANPQLLNGVNMQHEAADSVSSAPDVLSGEKEGDETFRGQATRVEQAVKQLTVFAGNYILMLTQIAKNNALLNFNFMPDEVQVDTQDPATQQPSTIKIGRDLYRDEFDILFSADLSFQSRAAKVAEADDVLGMLTKGIPPQIASLVTTPQMFAGAIRKSLQARGMYDLAAMMPSDQEIQMKLQAQMAPPPGPPPGPGGPAPHPSIPTGRPTNTPGAVPPQSHVPRGIPAQAAPAPMNR